ncbi:reverse transcriptase domain-containing protein [Vibrio campbellii]|uniref:reverse transcriptase domain-containing protein n=1 Tax=Vibrio campbellii TaxID=680 RepID=UPI00249A4F70|nr:reverse transcriptase domain-containing protein [Vibrio campbellii]
MAARRGISRGCALSPLLGAFHLYGLDVRLASITGVTYERYMDDFLLLTSSRWVLRRAIRRLNRAFEWLGFIQHPLKTFFGRLHRGVEWLGYALDDEGRSAPSPRSVFAWVQRQAEPLFEEAAWSAFAYRKWRAMWGWTLCMDDVA